MEQEEKTQRKFFILRGKREYLFKKLDAYYLMADEQSDSQEKYKIATIKQKLRDMPTSPEVLAAPTFEDCHPVAFTAYEEYISQRTQ